ncbi:MAG: hypothetical protein NPIRA05_00210 [Nitrospirales bacterium]|nr:MAG: hypothetical protein NPIRA05_00210 [Nitrospirales bacterium]
MVIWNSEEPAGANSMIIEDQVSSFEITVPNVQPGPFEIGAIVVATTGDLDIASVRLEVLDSQPYKFLRAVLPHFNLTDQGPRVLTVYGVTSDGTARNLRNSPRLSIGSSDSSVVEVTSLGVIQAVGPGEAIVNATFDNSLSLEVPVRVAGVPVKIAINSPETDPVINAANDSKVRLAFLSFPGFSTETLVPESVRIDGKDPQFFEGGNSFERGDVNNDGVSDLFFEFSSTNLDISNPSLRLIASATTQSGTFVAGEADARVVNVLSKVAVPDTVGRSQGAAQAAITGAGLSVGSVVIANSSLRTQGSIIRQQPTAGLEVSVGNTVDLVVSAGPMTILVPEVEGLSRTNAEVEIINARLTVGTVRDEESEVNVDNVIRQDPVAGSQTVPGGAVSLLISAGTSILVPVPDVMKVPQAEAESAIVTVGLTVGSITMVSNSTVPAGSVISQDPLAGTEVPEGSAVNLEVSSGPDLVDVPSVVDLPQSEAEAQIIDAGLTVGDIAQEPSNVVVAGSVTRQDPVGGTQTDRDSEVNLFISTGMPGILVPNVQGRSREEATNQITNAGLILGAVLFERTGSQEKGTVLRQSPLADAIAQVGDAVSLVLATGPMSVFLESSTQPGQFVIEGETFSGRTASSENTWLLVPGESAGVPSEFLNFRGSGYIQALPDSNNVSDPLAAPFVDYKVCVKTPGTYRLFSRWGTFNNNSDTMYVGIVELTDGPGGAIADWYRHIRISEETDFAAAPTWFGQTGFERTDSPFSNGEEPTTWNIPEPGMYTIRFGMREDGAALDSFVFQLSDLVSPQRLGPTATSIGELSDCSTLENQLDLTITDIDKSKLTYDGQALSVAGFMRSEVKNLGQDDIASSFDVLFFEDQNSNGIYDPGTDQVLGNTTVVGGLGAGDSKTVSASLSGSVRFSGNLIYGFVDSGDSIAESNENNNLANCGEFCGETPTLGKLDPELEWSWTSSSVEPEFVNVIMTPIVIDLDGDDLPEVIFGSRGDSGGTNRARGFLRVISGVDGTERFTVTSHQISASSQLAAGDIDQDGFPEIIAVDSTFRQLIAFEHNGDFKWVSSALDASTEIGGPSLADLDGDGVPEIIQGRQVLDADGSILWTGTGGVGSHGSRAAGILSLVADINMDGTPDVVAGNTVYNNTGTIQWEASVTDGYNAVGNFDDDDFPEVVLVSFGQVSLLEHDGTIKWGPTSFPGSGNRGGPPTVADFDNDGEVEIGVAGRTRYAVFEADGSIKWLAVIGDTSSILTGSTVFDFEGDGSMEVVYSDHTKLYVFRGADGAVLFDPDLSSGTLLENPVVVDVDADGHAEIIAAANDNLRIGPQRGVFAYGSASDSWVSTRKLWNQHTYHITNINDDGTVPSIEQNNWETFNNYRANVRSNGSGGALSDLTASFVQISSSAGSLSLTARIGNGGAESVDAGASVSYYDGDPRLGGVLLGTVLTTTALEPGQFEDVALALSSSTSTSNTIWVVADDSGALKGEITECNEVNNIHDSGLKLVGRPVLIMVPDVVDRPEEEAGDIIEDASLVVGNVTRAPSESVPVGSVIRQSPNAGEKVEEGTAVNLVVSSGPALVTVPNVVGLPQADAETTIVGANLSVGMVTTATSMTVLAGAVISQTPVAGQEVLPQSIVNLVVSSGSEPACKVAPDPDLNNDEVVNILDVSLVSSCLGQDPSAVAQCQIADTNCDGVVDATDLNFVTSGFGQSGF